jgi:hypothetical protein
MRGTRSPKATLWIGAAATALAALLFPDLEAVKNKGQPLWEFWPHDREGLLLDPLIIVLTIALFALLGGWAWSGAGNRPAKVGLVCGILGPVGVVAFFVSAPIILGGLAITLGVEGRRRAGTAGKGTQALTAIALGAVAFVLGAGIWVLAQAGASDLLRFANRFDKPSAFSCGGRSSARPGRRGRRASRSG